MAQAIPFKEMNGEAAAPDTAPDIGSLPLFKAPGKIITKWRLSVKEIEEVSKHGHLWIILLTNDQSIPALGVMTETPFEELPNG